MENHLSLFSRYHSCSLSPRLIAPISPRLSSPSARLRNGPFSALLASTTVSRPDSSRYAIRAGFPSGYPASCISTGTIRPKPRMRKRKPVWHQPSPKGKSSAIRCKQTQPNTVGQDSPKPLLLLRTGVFFMAKKANSLPLLSMSSARIKTTLVA